MHIIPPSHSLYLMGDYHQASAKLLENLRTIAASGTPASLVMLGDYASGGCCDLADLRALLADFEIDAYLLRGNHDNPSYWQDRELSAAFETDRFKLLHEVDVLQWGSQLLLTVNGAVSVDRSGMRTVHGGCWPETEGVPEDALTQMKSLLKSEELSSGVDVLLSHTGLPEEAATKSHFVQQYLSTDPDLESDIAAERKRIQQILIASGAESFYFGHFHISETSESYGVSTRCLNIGEMTEI